MSVLSEKTAIKYVRNHTPQGVYRINKVCYNFHVREIMADFFVCHEKGKR